MASRAVDLLITYRIVKLLVTPFEKQEAFKFGIINEKGKVLKKYRDLRTEAERKSYTLLHRFVFNLKRILQRVGLGGKLASFGVALALLIREDKSYAQHKTLIESVIIKYLKEENLFEEMLNEVREIPEIDAEPYMVCFGMSIYEKDGELVTENDYAKTL